jgi:NAD(P)-dependent dehydrogenase (short-subunit alcohol dehydrogenase family)
MRREMKAQMSQVLTTSSIAGFNRMAPSGFAYGQSKAATTHSMEQLASNLAPYKIRCNIFAPGCRFCCSFSLSSSWFQSWLFIQT